MFQLIPNIIKKTFTYGFFYGISASVPFFLLPVLTRYLSPEGYGIISIITIIILFLGCIFRLEVQASLKREYIEHKADFSEYVGSALFIPIFIFCVSFVIFSVSYYFLEGMFFIAPLWILGILIMTLGAALSTYLVALYQIKDKAMAVGLWGLLESTTIFFGTFVLVVLLGFDWQGRIWPILSTAIIVQIPLSFYLIYSIVPYRLNFDLAKTMEMLKFSVPLIPMTISIYILQVADRIFITEMIGLEAAGLYAVSAQLAAIMAIAYSSFLPTWEVLVMQKLKENTSEGYKYIIFFFCLFVVAMLVLALLVIFIFPLFIPWILGKDFAGSIQFLSWLVFGILARGVFFALLPFFYYIKKTTIIMYTNIFLVAVNLLLNYMLISINGAVGAAQATFIVYVVGISIFLYNGLKHFRIPVVKNLKNKSNDFNYYPEL